MWFVTLLLFLGIAYVLVQYIYVYHPAVMEPVSEWVKEPVNELLQITRLADWIPSGNLRRKKGPNRYGSGGMDPAGGERKGGDGRGIPDEVDVGWWNGNITYPERHLSPVQDTEAIPAPQVADVGWWGDDWMV